MPERPTTAQRGYGTKHQAERAKWQKIINNGGVTCWRCHASINPNDWHLGHDDHDRTKYRGPECPTCNTKAGGQAGAAITNAKHTMTIREW